MGITNKWQAPPRSATFAFTLALLLELAIFDRSKADGESSPGAALLNAVGEGKSRDVETLLQAGAPIDYKNEYGETALHISAISGDKVIIQKLLDAGGDPSAVTYGTYPAHKEIVRRSVLMWHVPSCDDEIVTMLIDAGADVFHINEIGENILQISKKAGDRCSRVTKILEEAMHDSDIKVHAEL